MRKRVLASHMLITSDAKIAGSAELAGTILPVLTYPTRMPRRSTSRRIEASVAERIRFRREGSFVHGWTDAER